MAVTATAALPGAWRVALASSPVDPGDRFLYHKTTVRDVYENALAEAAGFEDVLLWNPSRALTESTRANFALRRL